MEEKVKNSTRKRQKYFILMLTTQIKKGSQWLEQTQCQKGR